MNKPVTLLGIVCMGKDFYTDVLQQCNFIFVYFSYHDRY
jgi:hypothetical protein